MPSLKEIAIAYIRVSTVDQATEGVSLDDQRQRIELWCAASGYELLEVAVDAGISGSRADNRPGLQTAIALACEKKAALVVYSLSRLGRSTTDILNIANRLDRCGGNLVSLSEKLDTTSAAGRMIFRVLAVIAEFERDIIVERTISAMSHLRVQNRRISRFLPFGFVLDETEKFLVECPEEQEILKLMKIQRSRGEGYEAIAKLLNKKNFPSKTGKQWSGKTVRGVLLRDKAA